MPAHRSSTRYHPQFRHLLPAIALVLASAGCRDAGKHLPTPVAERAPNESTRHATSDVAKRDSRPHEEAHDEADEMSAHVDGFTYAGVPTRKSTITGNLDQASCLAKLKKAKVPFVPAPGAARIAFPVVITGPIGGVSFDTGRPYAARNATSGDAIDCRLALALVDLAVVVKRHGIVTVMVKSFHRPTQVVVDPGAPLRHRIGFAIDIAGFVGRKGKTWEVLRDFHGKVGQATCGKAAAKPFPDTPEARTLWSLFCEIVATEAFDSGISPNYNASHFDHVHFDLTHDHPIFFFP